MEQTVQITEQNLTSSEFVELSKEQHQLERCDKSCLMDTTHKPRCSQHTVDIQHLIKAKEI